MIIQIVSHKKKNKISVSNDPRMKLFTENFYTHATAEKNKKKKMKKFILDCF